MPRKLMRQPRRWSNVQVTSTPALAAAVQARTEFDSKILVPEPYFVGRPQTQVSIDNLLRDLGKYTTPPHLALMSFHAASQWAWLRYRWAFCVDQKNLFPTLQAMALPHHHATAFSEHIGIAFGLDVARKALMNRHPGAAVTFFDVDFALAGFRPGLPPLAVGPRRPDYLARVITGGVAVYYAIECKGRRYTSGAAMHKQMATGALQVQSLRVNGRTLPSLIVATTANETGITVAVLDPDDEGVRYNLPERVAPAAAFPVRDLEQDSLDFERFAQRMEAVVVADILLEAGDLMMAGEVLQEEPLTSDRTDVESFTINDLTSLGQLVRFPMPGSTLNAFRGVSEESVVRARNGLTGPSAFPLNKRTPEEENFSDMRPDGGVSDTEDLVADYDDSGFTVATWSD